MKTETTPYFRITIAVLALIAGLMAAYAVSAQTVPGSIKLAWTLPTTGCTNDINPCDNVPLTGLHALIGVEVYISTSPIPDNSTMAPTLVLEANAARTTHTMAVTNGDTLYARIKAVNNGRKSPFSAQVTKLIQLEVTPGVPTDVTIELQIG